MKKMIFPFLLVTGCQSGCQTFKTGPVESAFTEKDRAACKSADNLSRIALDDKRCLVIQTYRYRDTISEPTLLILLHGSPPVGNPVDYMYFLGQVMSSKKTVGVAIIRPGNHDSFGNTSYGTIYYNNDDNDIDSVDTVAAAIAKLREFHHAKRVVIVGHSLGAMQTGVLLGKFPGIAEAGVIVAGAGDLKAWSLGRHGSKYLWKNSLSPSDFVTQIPKDTKMVLLAGSHDDIFTPRIMQGYVNLLQQHEIYSKLIVTEDNHDSIVESVEVRDAIKSLLE